MNDNEPTMHDMLEFVKNKYKGDENILLQFKISQNSVEERFHFTSFHLAEATKYFDELGLADKDGLYITQEILRHVHDPHWKYNIVCYKACILAALQNIHSFADTLGNMVYIARGMDFKASTKIKKKGRYLKSIIKKITDYPELNQELSQIFNTGGFAKIDRLNNDAKHESIFPLKLRQNFELADDVGFRTRIEEFDEQGETIIDNEGNAKIEIIDLHALISSEYKRCVSIRTRVRKLILSEQAQKI